MSHLSESGIAMAKINAEISIEDMDGQSCICLRILEENSFTAAQAVLFSEIGEGLVAGNYKKICIDLAAIQIVSSSTFGACMNIITMAKDRGKSIILRLSKDSAETARIANIHRLVTIQEMV
jgi:anti-anti-sigma regulatory factor